MALRGGTAISEYRLGLTGFRQDVRFVESEIKRLEGLANSTKFTPQLGGGGRGGGGGGSGGAIPDLDAANLRLSKSVLSVAQAQARAAAAEGDRAGAARILTQALDSASVVDLKQGLQIKTQIASYTAGRTAMQQFGDSVKSGFLGMVAPAAAASLAIGSVFKVVDSFKDAFQFKTNLDATNMAIQAQVSSFRNWTEVNNEAQAYAVRFKMTQAELQQTLQASVPVMRMSTASVTDLFGAIARLQTLAPEKPISEAARALRELATGDVTSIKELFNVPAKDALRMKNEIQNGADAVQVLSKYLDSMGISMGNVEQQTRGAMGAMKDLAIAEEELKIAQGEWAAGPGLALMENWTRVVRGATRVMGGAGGMSEALRQASAESEASRVAQQTYTVALQQGATEEEARALAMQRGAEAASVKAYGDLNAAAAQQALIQVTVTATGEDERRSFVLRDEAQATSQADLATQGHVTTLADHLTKTQNSTLATQDFNSAQATLASLGGQVAQGLMTANAAAMGLAQAYGIAYTEAYKLIAAQAALAQTQMAAQALTDQRAGERSGGQFRTAAEQTAYSNSLRQQARAAEEAAEAQARYQQQLGNYGPALAAARKELDSTVKGTAAYWNALAKLNQLEEASEKKSHARGKAAGAAKLSQSQKLGNDLLKNQITYENKLEDAERDHYKKVLKIQRDYEKASLASLRQSETDKRRSRLDFYMALEELQNSGDKRLQAIAVQASQEYEAAERERARLAAEGKVALGNDYLALRKKQIEEEIALAKQLAEAEAAKDKDRIARLKELQRQQQELHAEEQKQLLEGGDRDQTARDEALASENERYSEQQQDIMASSDQAAETKIRNAKISTQAVIDENEALERQKQLYDELGGKRGVPTGAPGTPGALPDTGNAPVGLPTTPPEGGSQQAPGQGFQAFADAMRALGDTISARFGEVGVQITTAITQQSTMQAQKFDMLGQKLDALGSKLDAVERAARSRGSAVG